MNDANIHIEATPRAGRPGWSIFALALVLGLGAPAAALECAGKKNVSLRFSEATGIRGGFYLTGCEAPPPCVAGQDTGSLLLTEPPVEVIIFDATGKVLSAVFDESLTKTGTCPNGHELHSSRNVGVFRASYGDMTVTPLATTVRGLNIDFASSTLDARLAPPITVEVTLGDGQFWTADLNVCDARTREIGGFLTGTVRCQQIGTGSGNDPPGREPKATRTPRIPPTPRHTRTPRLALDRPRVVRPPRPPRPTRRPGPHAIGGVGRPDRPTRKPRPTRMPRPDRPIRPSS